MRNFVEMRIQSGTQYLAKMRDTADLLPSSGLRAPLAMHDFAMMHAAEFVPSAAPRVQPVVRDLIEMRAQSEMHDISKMHNTEFMPNAAPRAQSGMRDFVEMRTQPEMHDPAMMHAAEVVPSAAPRVQPEMRDLVKMRPRSEMHDLAKMRDTARFLPGVAPSGSLWLLACRCQLKEMMVMRASESFSL